MILDKAELKTNSIKLLNAENAIRDYWNSIKNVDIDNMLRAWAGRDCELCVEKILEFDTYMKKALIEINDLAKALARLSSE